MLAIIKTGGHQYIVKPGQKLKIEKLEMKEGETVVFSDVLLLNDDKKLVVGTPMVEGATVSAKVVTQGRGDKIIVFKYKPKKRYRRKIGHRQPFTEVEITDIKN